MLALSGIFAVDIAAYAVMSNHYHIVLRIDASRGMQWGTNEVLTRWTQLFNGPSCVQNYLEKGPESLSAAELAQVEEYATLYRARLHDLSWFMRVLNESIARQANQEDGVKGRFWEGRFKSQALLDEKALLAAMAYVDLNPVRAGIAADLKSCEFTGIARRIRNVTKTPALPVKTTSNTSQTTENLDEIVSPAPLTTGTSEDHAAETGKLRSEKYLKSLQPAPLMPFDPTAQFEVAIPFGFEDYLELVDTLGRCIHPMKPGHIPEKTPRLLLQMGMNTETFVTESAKMLKSFGHVIGTVESLCELAARKRKQRIRGIAIARKVFNPKAA
ncbi:hypothetical protein SAMN05421693_10686 [Ectothiorhodospira magna]|uniref:Transposase IS200-like domain-containing protein n=2 Tax=Ectothiorhodospira magna TaxID=867345 RepID=A0A1H9AUT2_9GAMM|nr:hypothetical protein SAMN05421693_10686 [Ectothiorhodospira magna]